MVVYLNHRKDDSNVQMKNESFYEKEKLSEEKRRPSEIKFQKQAVRRSAKLEKIKGTDL